MGTLILFLIMTFVAVTTGAANMFVAMEFNRRGTFAVSKRDAFLVGATIGYLTWLPTPAFLPITFLLVVFYVRIAWKK